MSKNDIDNGKRGFVDRLETLLDMADEMGLKIPEVVLVDHSAFMEYLNDSRYYQTRADLLAKRENVDGGPMRGEIGLLLGTVIKGRFAGAYPKA